MTVLFEREALGRRAPIAAFWCRVPSRPNFGDALTPWLIHRITGQYPQFVSPDNRRHKYLVTGSIASYADANCTVWGCGILNWNDQISAAAEFLAVRGPLTRRRATECGAKCPVIYGDPALLLPRLYHPQVETRWRLGLIPHFSDMPRVAGLSILSREIRLIDIQDPIETVIDQIASCQFVASSSLHGIIVSHSFGVPAAWIKFGDLPSGDDSKFHDYFLSIGIKSAEPLRTDYRHIQAEQLIRRAAPPRVELDVEALWEACPFGA